MSAEREVSTDGDNHTFDVSSGVRRLSISDSTTHDPIYNFATDCFFSTPAGNPETSTQQLQNGDCDFESDLPYSSNHHANPSPSSPEHASWELACLQGTESPSWMTADNDSTTAISLAGPPKAQLRSICLSSVSLQNSSPVKAWLVADTILSSDRWNEETSFPTLIERQSSEFTEISSLPSPVIIQDFHHGRRSVHDIDLPRFVLQSSFDEHRDEIFLDSSPAVIHNPIRPQSASNESLNNLREQRTRQAEAAAFFVPVRPTLRLRIRYALRCLGQSSRNFVDACFASCKATPNPYSVAIDDNSEDERDH